MTEEIKQEENKYYGLKNDIVFKHIFGTEDNKEYTIELISEILNIDKLSFKDAKITNSVKLDRETVSKKQFETDIVLETKEIIYSLEMQKENTVNTEIKNTMYGMKIFSNQLKKGEEYEKTKPLIQICIVDYNKQDKDKKVLIEKYNIRSEIEREKRIVKDLFDIYVVDLGVEIKKEKISRNLRGWIELIRANSLEENEEVKKKYPKLKEVMKEMEYFTEQEYVQDHIADDKLLRSNISLARKEGREEGKIEGENIGYTKGVTYGKLKGLNEANINMARKMLESNKDIDEISYFTSLPKEKIMKLREEIRMYNGNTLD